MKSVQLKRSLIAAAVIGALSAAPAFAVVNVRIALSIQRSFLLSSEGNKKANAEVAEVAD